MKKLIAVLFIFYTCSLIAATTQQLKLYDEPKSTSKVVAVVNSPASLVEIYQQGDWVKIGDTKTGNVGWVQQKTLDTMNGDHLFSVTFTKKNKDGGQIIQYFGTAQVNKQKVSQLIEKLNKQQVEMQVQMDKLFQKNMADFNALWNELTDNDAQSSTASTAK